jgi:hypothetical protein
LRFIDDKKPGYTLKAPAVIHLIPFLKPSLLLNNHDKQGGGGPLLNLDANGFTMIEINISLT